MSEQTFTAKWGDEIELDLQYHTSHLGVRSDGEENFTYVSMNNKHLLDMAFAIIKELT